MGDLATLYSQAKKQSLWINEGLRRLEEWEGGARHGDIAAVAKDLQARVAELQRLSQDLQSVWRMNGVRGSRTEHAVWSGKVTQVAEDAQAARKALEKYTVREQKRQVEQQEREELFAHANKLRSDMAARDAEAQISKSVHNSHRELERIYEAGRNILGNMASNKERLKAAQKKMLDVLNSVGLGTTLLKLIERRQRMDILLTYGGMVAMTLIVVVLMWVMWF